MGPRPTARRALALASAALVLAGAAAAAARDDVGPAVRQGAPAAPRPAAQPRSATADRAAGAAHLRPKIVFDAIPFGARRKREMDAYVRRHYGPRAGDHVLRRPKVIVEHFTASSTYASAYATFAADVPDVELHELPGVCSHFVIDKDGTIHQLVPLGLKCRHTVGLNNVSWGIEHVGESDREILTNRAQMRSSLRLTRWLRCRAGISIPNVIGHSESLSSPYHHELVPALKRQTHGDWSHANMQTYRHRLKVQGGCG